MTLPDPVARRTGVLPDSGWLVPVVLASAAVCVTTRQLELVGPLLAVGLLPWLLLAAGRPLPLGAFGVLGIGPAVGILVVDGLNASVFLGTTALTLLASRADRPWRLAGVTVLGIALPFASLAHPGPLDLGTVYFAIGDLFGIVVGVLLGHTRRLDAELRAADARLAAGAAQEERTRMARDVHDLVAHSLTVVVLQVGGARRVLRADPDRAEAALAQAEQVCRDSLDGVRQVVGLLRSGDDGPVAAVDLLHLVETYRSAGMPVDLDDASADLPLVDRVTVYRVVQEALANAARYRAPGTRVVVRAGADGRGATASVRTVGGSGPRSGPGGYGLTGLQEQVASRGGTLHAGADGDTWVVECRLPHHAVAAPVTR